MGSHRRGLECEQLHGVAWTLIERAFRERIILVGVVFPGRTAEQVDEELDELALLVDSAGADVVERAVQHAVTLPRPR